MNIEKFKNAIGGGVRNALFRVRGNIGTTTSPDTLSFLVTATNLPVSNLDTIETNYRGRTIKLPGSRKFDDWSVTILNDKNMELRTLFEKWLDDLNGAVTNVAQRDISLTNPVDFPTWYVDQLDRNGNAIKSYELHYCFPTSVASVELSAENEGISDFEVTLAYTYHLTSGVNGVPLGAAPERE